MLQSLPGLFGAAVALQLIAVVSRGVAQEQPAVVDPAAVQAPVLQPPQLLESKDAEYPAGIDPQQPAPQVVLRLNVDTEGRVTETEVVESGGPAFDEAARLTALGYRLTPGTRDGVPVVSRVLAKVAFRAPEQVIAPPPTPGPSAAPSAAGAAAGGPAQEVVVRGRQRESDRLAQSAEAVVVQELTRAGRESSSMAEVVARIPGVTVRRAGGLGSSDRISVNGLSDEQVPTFVDTIPPEFSYATAGLGSFPVNLSERIEVYKGVVPVRFGADALGGAINVVTDQRAENHLGVSAELGSFGTQRLSLSAAYRHEPSGLVARLLSFYDHADNDYEVDVIVADESGGSRQERVPRFHDAYGAYGVATEVGVVDKPWARRLFVQAYLSGHEKEIQHNVIMTVPYGEVRSAEHGSGLTGRYEVDLMPQLTLQVIAAYSYRETEFVDRSEWVYDWYGERKRLADAPGEVSGEPSDDLTFRDNVLGRVTLAYTLAPAHTITATTSPTYASQYGETRLSLEPGERDPLAALSERIAVVSGLEYEANLLPMAGAAQPSASTDEADYRVQNSVFVKHYLFQLWVEQTALGGSEREQTKDIGSFGVGDGVRVRMARWAWLKLSYEYATRIPNAFELFGDGGLVLANLELEPEVSHNFNFTPVFEWTRTKLGDLHVELNAFVRAVDDQIALLSSNRVYKSENVASTRSLGADASISWTSPGRYLSLDGSTSFLDLRNTSTSGDFAAFEGDRMPNQPWLSGNWAARLHFEVLRRHRIEPFYWGRFVAEFFRGWESVGVRESKQTVPSQVAHTIGVTYSHGSESIDYSATFEVQNLTNALLYDYFGTQRPGRGFSFKLVGALH